MKTNIVFALLLLTLASGASQVVLADPPQGHGPYQPPAAQTQTPPATRFLPPMANPLTPVPFLQGPGNWGPFIGQYGPFLPNQGVPSLIPVAGQTPDNSPAPTPDPTPKPVPAIPNGNGFYPDVIQGQVDDARLKYKIEVPRPFGWTIMDVVPIDVEMVTDSKVTLDLSSIMKQGIIGFKGADYRFALLDPHLLVRQQDGDKVMYLLKLNVQTSVFKTMVPFVLDFRYARDTQPGKDPIWKDAETLPLNLTYANPTDDGTDPMQGPLDFVSGDSPYQLWTAMVLSTILIGLLPGVLLLRYFHRILPTRAKTREEIAWQTLKPTFKAGLRFGFTAQSYEQIAVAIRFYFDCRALTLDEIRQSRLNEPRLSVLLEVLSAYEKAIDGEVIAPETQKSLMRQVALLVPRPLGIL